MVKIELASSLKSEIEEKHWNYFKSNCLTELEKIIGKEKNALCKEIYSYLLDAPNNNNRLKHEVLFGNQKEHESVIKHLNSLISIAFRTSNIDEQSDKLALTQPLIPAYSNFTKVNLANDIKSLEYACQYFDELKTLFISQKPIETVSKAKETGQLIRQDYKKLSDAYNAKVSDVVRFKASIRFALEKVFDYEKFVNSYDDWGAYSLTTKLSINSCPYCNRAYIHTHKTKEQGKTRPHLDHFYSKSDYPYLALSIYNLIPSCYVCNSSFKGSKDFYKTKHLHPYENSFGVDAVFTTEFVKNEKGNYNISLISSGTKTDGFDLQIKVSEASLVNLEIKNSITTFQLDSLYNRHKDYVLEIIRKSIIYNPERIKELSNDTFKGLFESKEELIQTLIGNYILDKDLNKRVLSKLTKDIWEEFGLKEMWGQ